MGLNAAAKSIRESRPAKMHCCLKLLLSAVLVDLCTAELNLSRMFQEEQMRMDLLVTECPKVTLVQVPKDKLLGVWVAYATTPLPYNDFKRRCIAHNVAHTTIFKDAILFYDEIGVLITYKCIFDARNRKFTRKLHVLTRTHTPTNKTIWVITHFLLYIEFPLTSLFWMGGFGFCFELYMLKFETNPRPMNFQAPFNQIDDFKR